MGKDKIKIVVVERGNPVPYVKEIENSLKAMQEVVGGYIEYVNVNGFDLFCNEEGKLQGLPLTFPIYVDGRLVDVIAGTFFLSKADDEGNQRSLTDDECREAIEAFTLTPELKRKFLRDLQKLMLR